MLEDHTQPGDFTLACDTMWADPWVSDHRNLALDKSDHAGPFTITASVSEEV